MLVGLEFALQFRDVGPGEIVVVKGAVFMRSPHDLLREEGERSSASTILIAE